MNNTLIKGLQVIELLAHSSTPMSLTEIARALGLTKSNVHRLLAALSDSDYVIRDPDQGGYTASIRLWELGSAVLSKLDLRTHAAHRMESLAEQTGESVHLSIQDRDEVVYVHKVDSPNPIRAYSQIGGRAPIHCVATGKAMLAFKSRESLLWSTRHLQAHTEATITRPEAMLAEAERIRRQGYAVNAGEWREGVHGVGVPIFDGTGQVIAAIGLSGPKDRFTPEHIEECADLLKHAAQDIMAHMGSNPSQHTLTHLYR
ncbi:MAG TPA: IclR family transcriptional regulator [Castellaniella sp.]|nr:IclR family transcriptional regulator [Castellaniella sp.]